MAAHNFVHNKIKKRDIIKISERVATHVDKSLFILEFSAGYNFDLLLLLFDVVRFVVVVFFHLRLSGGQCTNIAHSSTHKMHIYI